MTNKEELCYLAGYFDGEGTIGLYLRRNDSFMISCELGQTKKEAIKIFHKRFGGSLKEMPANKIKNKKAYCRWNIHSQNDILYFLETLLPYLKEKKPQAELMVEYCKVNVNSKGKQLSLATIEFRTKIASELKELKK